MRTSGVFMTGSSIVVGLNGALQKRFVLPEATPLIPGDVHRAKEIQVGVGGKGQDVAIALSCLPYTGNVQLAQFVGKGPEGDVVFDLLEKRLGKEAMELTVRPRSSLRTCTTIVASDVSTELVEPSDPIEPEELAELMTKLGSETAAATLCIMGSMPPGCPSTTYASIFDKVQTSKTLTLIDSVVGLDELLKAIGSSTQKGSTILKVNASELCRLAKVEKSSSESAGIDPAELVDGVTSFLQNFSPYAAAGLDGIAVTDGKHPAHFVAVNRDMGECQIFKVDAPDLTSKGTLYPIGAGDTVAGGTLAAWHSLASSDGSGSFNDEAIQLALAKNEELVTSMSTEPLRPGVSNMVTAFAFGLACGSASCLEEENSIFDVKEALRLFQEDMAAPLPLLSVPMDAS